MLFLFERHKSNGMGQMKNKDKVAQLINIHAGVSGNCLVIVGVATASIDGRGLARGVV